MSGSLSRTTVLIYSTIQSTNTKPTIFDPTELPSSTNHDRKGFTRVAIGAAVGGFFMTVLLACALVWLWKRRHPTRPWDRRSENDVETAVQSVEHPALEEDKSSRSPPVSDSVCAPRDYEYGSYGNPAVLAVSPGTRPGSALSVHSLGRQSPVMQVVPPSTPSSALPVSHPSSRRGTLERDLSTSEAHFTYPSPPLPPSAWHGPPSASMPGPHNIPLPPSPRISKRRQSLPQNTLPHSHYRSLSSSSHKGADFTSASSHSSHSSRRIVITHPQKVFFLDPEPDPLLEENRGTVKLTVTNPDRKDPTPPPTPKEQSSVPRP